MNSIYRFACFCILVIFCSCRQEGEENSSEHDNSYWTSAILENEAQAYKVYYSTTDAKVARDELLKYCSFLATAPDNTIDLAKLRYTAEALALSRIQLINWYISSEKIDLTKAAIVLQRCYQDKHPDIGIAQLKIALVSMIEYADKDKVKWVTAESVRMARGNDPTSKP